MCIFHLPGRSIIGAMAMPLALVLLVGLAGCAGVKVASVASRDAVLQQRGDVLTTGALSASAMLALHIVGVDGKRCRDAALSCRTALGDGRGLSQEQRLSALTELWLLEAMHRSAGAGSTDVAAGRVIDAYFEAARHAYAYLFFSERRHQQRALEERQGQVKDYYNFAVQQSATRLFNVLRRDAQPVARNELAFASLPGAAKWTVRVRSDERLAGVAARPLELIAASSLTFQGVRNLYRRDGIGAALVAVTDRIGAGQRGAAVPFSETPYPSSTAILSFPGETLEQVLATHDAQIAVYDPYRHDKVQLSGNQVPLAADFTSGYGLWLARSGFGMESVRSLLGKGRALSAPRVYLMQPFDPSRRTIIMLHGLASSPEAWINVANEVHGDDRLRQGYQIWQVYYPTNVPVPINHLALRRVLDETFRHFDPAGTAVASREVVLIGHSMGGLLARLMVSSSGERLWNSVLSHVPLEGERLAQARDKLGKYMHFTPMPQIGRAVFIAAPHRGTPFAQGPLARWAARLVSLPATVRAEVHDIVTLLTEPGAGATTPTISSVNGIRNLSDADAFVRAAADLPLSAGVPYHSIIATENASIALRDGSDGLVPYTSAHLAGAASEKVIVSGHSVQESAPAILEIRRILHLHLGTAPLAAPYKR